MQRFSHSITQLFFIIVFFVSLFFSLSVQAEEKNSTLPYRFLVVISDQWNDPASYLVDENNEFKVLLTLLKTWGLPFDILRLDHQNLDRYHLLERNGSPRYSTVIWDADPGGAVNEDLSLLPSLVKDYGMNMVVLGNSVALPEVEDLAGLRFVSEYRLDYKLKFSGEHFITRDLLGREMEFNNEIDYYSRGSKVLPAGALVLAKRGHLPFLTVREFPDKGRVLWLDADRKENKLQTQIIRDLFKRSLVWANGYALYAEYPKSIILFMDDFGTSDRTYLPYWHYRTLNESDIRNNIIKPLKEYNAVLNMNVLTGFVDRKSERIVNPWQQKVIDEIDGKTVHDYISAKRGLDAGLSEGVLEIQCHGYTHMLPDLESPPGPFWTADMDGAGTLGFDYEFGDPVRGEEIPAITQKFLLSRGLEYIQNDFGVVPLFIINGGGAISRSYPNNSNRIAAQMGFGLGHFNTPGYLGRDIVITSMEPVIHRTTWQYDRKISDVDIPWTIDAPFFLIFHDRDVSLDPDAMRRLLKNLGNDTRYMSANEYCGYLHTEIKLNDKNDHSLSFMVNYDNHYCRYFSDHESYWTLHLSDKTNSEFKNTMPEKQIITVPQGSERRVIESKFIDNVE